MKAIPLFKLAGQYDEMDVLARAQFLEGYLHVQPFHYIKGALGKSQLIMSIVKMLHEIGGTPSPEWVSKMDTGLYKATYRAVSKAISSQRGERAMEAGDILQTMMGVSGWEGESGKSPFWMAGKHVSTDSPEAFTSGKMQPVGASGLTVRLAYRRALDTIRAEADRAKKRHEHHEDIIDETVSGESAQEDWGQIIDAVFTNPDHPISKKFFGWLDANIPNVMRRGEGARLMSGYLGLLRSGTVSSDVAAAAALGSSSAALSNTKKVFMDSMAGYMSSDPRVQLEVQDMFSDAKFFQDLLRGNIHGSRVGSLASRVAARFMKIYAAGRSYDHLIRELPITVTVVSDQKHNADFQRIDKAAEYIRRLLRTGFSPLDIQVESGDVEMDIVEDLGVRMPRVAARHNYEFKKDVKLKSGITIPKGTPATVSYERTEEDINKTGVAYATVMPDFSELPMHPQKGLIVKIESLTKYLDGYPKMPTESRLEKMNSDGVATTPLGERVEPDGFGPSGAPSWLLVAGVI